MIADNNRPKPVRRILTTYIHGELPADVRVVPACPNKLCVSPTHTMVKAKWSNEAVSLIPPPPEECDQDDINDVIDAVYSRDQPWAPEALAEHFKYPLALVEEAIRRIFEEGL